MNASERFQAAAALFLEADSVAEGELDVFLKLKCGADPELHSLVRHMLAGRDDPSVFRTLAAKLEPVQGGLRDQVVELKVTNRDKVASGKGFDEAPGDMIGDFRLQEHIGEGGFGRVWIAEQLEPVRRRVALKVIKAGMDSREVLTRFEMERQALAMMDHPGVAKVFDAGATARGRPFFVMEYVPGISITDFCNEGKLQLRQRVELVIMVCEAVHHAHQKGIIHRDLKPSNILVALIDGRPVPKVIDFGIAKAAASLVSQTLHTEAGRLMGTPEYMSPEQASGEMDIDTRSDVYSLGVVLYQLITGVLPFDSRMLRSAGPDSIARIIREVEPPKPSTRLSMLTADQHSRSDSIPPSGIAALRGTQMRSYQRELRAELDWIVMKCLEKDRSRRYESASQFAADLRRFLASEPVFAAPPSTVYRLRKFARRNKGAVGATAAIGAALVAGVVAFAWQAELARGQRDRAVEAEQETAKRVGELQKVSDFQEKMLTQVDATEAGKALSADVQARFQQALVKEGIADDERSKAQYAFALQWGHVNATDAARELIDRTILRPAVAAIGEQFADQPALDASLRMALASRYGELGLYEASMPLINRVLTTRRQILGNDHPDTIESIKGLGNVLQASGKYVEAEPYLRETLERSRRVLGDDDERTLHAINSLSVLLLRLGRYAEAEPLAREALEKGRRVLGNDHTQTLIFTSNLGSLLREQNKLAEAETLLSEFLESQRRLHGDSDLLTLSAMFNMTVLLKQEGKLLQAEPLARETLQKRRALLGEEHPSTVSSIAMMGSLLMAMGKLDEAESYLRDSLAIRRRILEKDNPDLLESITDMGQFLGRQGRLAEAESLQREALEATRRMFGEDHQKTLRRMSDLAMLLVNQNKFDEAEPICRDVLERRKRIFGDDHPDTLVSNNIMGQVFFRQNKFDLAEPYWREALERSTKLRGAGNVDTLTFAANFGFLLKSQNKLDEAEGVLRSAVESAQQALGNNHQLTLNITLRLAAVLVAQKKYTETFELLAPVEPAFRATFTGANRQLVAACLERLGRAKSGLSDFTAAEKYLLEATPIYVQVRGEAHVDTRTCMQGLVELYNAWDKAEPGKGHDTQSAEWSGKLDKLEPPAGSSGKP